MPCYLDCRIGWTNLLPINRVSEWSGSPLIAADTRYFCAIPNRFSSVVIVHALRHSGWPSIPFQFVLQRGHGYKLVLFETDGCASRFGSLDRCLRVFSMRNADEKKNETFRGDDKSMVRVVFFPLFFFLRMIHWSRRFLGSNLVNLNFDR